MSKHTAPNPHAAFDTLRAAGVIMWGDYGAWAYDTWASYNATYFDGALEPPGILWGLAPNNRKLGNYDTEFQIITLYSGLLDTEQTNLWGLDAWLARDLARDVLLHAMIHQKAGTSGCNYRSHNNEEWVNEVNRIAPLIGLRANAQVIPQMRKGQSLIWVTKEGGMRRRELSGWPMLSRPEEHYNPVTWKRFGEMIQGE
ncbi:MAG: hypothetical protein JXQ72_06105 [Anaerolineae bacterium]|nr:hypothetical protein [Anaerolineae bacterium]